jgi:hypothetical protein
MNFLLSSALTFTLLFLPYDVVQAVDPGGFVPCEGADCNACHFIQMFNEIIFWIIAILFLVFAVILVIAGFKLVTSGGNQTARDDAKGKLVNALIGIIIVLAAWLIIDNLVRAVLPGKEGVIEGWGVWNKVSCIEQNPIGGAEE